MIISEKTTSQTEKKCLTAWLNETIRRHVSFAADTQS